MIFKVITITKFPPDENRECNATPFCITFNLKFKISIVNSNLKRNFGFQTSFRPEIIQCKIVKRKKNIFPFLKHACRNFLVNS